MILITLLFLLEAINGQKIAIIGSGISGSSSAYYLNQIYENLNITMFEKSSRLGGRTYSRHFKTDDGQELTDEFGAGFIILQNKNVMKLIDDLGLEIFKMSESKRIGFWNEANQELFLETSEYSIITILKLIWRYGLGNIFGMISTVQQALKRFMNIYEYQDNGEVFEDLNEFLQRIEQHKVFNYTSENYMKHAIDWSPQLVDEFFNTMINNVYFQGHQANAVMGFIVSVAMNNPPYQVKNGIDQITNKLIQNMVLNQELNLMKQTTVTKIVKNKSDYTIQYQFNNQNFEETFDMVILASPMVSSNIYLQNIPFEKTKRKYIDETIAYYKGNFNHSKFGYTSKQELPDKIMSSDQFDDQIQQISFICKECLDHQDIVRFSSNQPLTMLKLQKYFVQNSTIQLIDQVTWASIFPDYSDTIGKSLPEFNLSPGFYYLNAMEIISSCLEMQTIMSRNVVNHIKKNQGLKWTLKTKNQLNEEL